MSHLKVYEEARTAHLERLVSAISRQRLLYRKRYYDFEDPSDSAIAKQVTRRMAFKELLSIDVDVVELNEPLFLRAMPSLIIYFFANLVRRPMGRHRFRIICYAIENLSIVDKISFHSRIPLALVRLPAIFVLRYMISRYDKIAFGTEAAYRAYLEVFPNMSKHTELKVISALEPLCSACDFSNKIQMVVFVSAFEERKGIMSLIEAWPLVLRERPNAVLNLLGKGELTNSVKAASSRQQAVSVIVDPSRATIHSVLSKSKVLILPSQSDRAWREQIGLPILEGLSHGCHIVTTNATGLAPWLKENGHIVTDNTSNPNVISQAIIRALDKTTSPSDLISQLPVVSGRAAAEAWLWA